jgi:tetratricopeptide (TPR) repeat protein
MERFGPDDDAVLAIAWQRIMDVEWFRGRLEAAHAAAERVLTYAERLDDVRRQADAQAFIGAGGFFGNAHIEVCLAHAREHVEWARAHGALAHEAAALFALGAMTMEQNRLDEGREIREQGWAMLRELGMRMALAAHQGAVGGVIGLQAVEPDALLERQRSAYETLASAGEKGVLSTVAANLAVSLYHAGEYEEAERFSHVSEEAGSPEDVATQVGWRAARAMVIARRNRFDEAEALAREALALASGSEYTETTAEAYLSLGEVLRLAEKPEEAAEAIQAALAIFEGKGFLLSADAVRAKLAELQSVGSPSQ